MLFSWWLRSFFDWTNNNIRESMCCLTLSVAPVHKVNAEQTDRTTFMHPDGYHHYSSLDISIGMWLDSLLQQFSYVLSACTFLSNSRWTVIGYATHSCWTVIIHASLVNTAICLTVFMSTYSNKLDPTAFINHVLIQLEIPAPYRKKKKLMAIQHLGISN